MEPVRNVQPGELRLAWLLLAVLAVLSFPSESGRITTTIGLLGFVPGALILANRKWSVQIASELDKLLAGSLGRMSLAVSLAAAMFIGMIFLPFVGIFMIAVVSEIMWLVALLSGASLARLFPSVTMAGAVSLGTLVASDAILNWHPVAREVGAPTELAQWRDRYDNVKDNNFFRFRSRYEDTRRRPGVRRIITLGDSFTEGHGIWSSDSTWPAQLERELNATAEGPPTEVINMGHGGFTTANEAELLRRIGWQFDPDLVIVQWLDNDAYPSFPNMRWEDPEDVTLIPPPFNSGFIRKSAIVSLLERALAARISKRRPTRSFYAPGEVGWLQLQAALKEMADSARQRCVPIVLAAYPYLFPGTWTAETYAERDLTQMVTALGKKDGYHVLDLTDVFATTTHPEEVWWVTPYDSHPNAVAQHRAVLVMSRFLREQRLLPDSAGSHPRCR